MDPHPTVDPRSSRRRVVSAAVTSAGVTLVVCAASAAMIIAIANTGQTRLPPGEVAESIVMAVIPQLFLGVVLFLVLWAMQEIRRSGWRIFWTTAVSIVGAVAGLLWGLVMTILTGLSATEQEVW